MRGLVSYRSAEIEGFVEDSAFRHATHCVNLAGSGTFGVAGTRSVMLASIRIATTSCYSIAAILEAILTLQEGLCNSDKGHIRKQANTQTSSHRTMPVLMRPSRAPWRTFFSRTKKHIPNIWFPNVRIYTVARTA